VIAPPDLTDSIRKVHDFLTVGAAAPLQQAGSVALALPRSYYAELQDHYTDLRDRALRMLEAAGFRCFRPGGAYYIMTDISGFGDMDDIAFVRHMIERVGVAAVPGSSFYSDPAGGSQFVRFCFCKKYETLDEAGSRLAKL
jgi:aminotransferase